MLRIPARVYSSVDRARVAFEFDAGPYFEDASVREILALASSAWGCSTEADGVARRCLGDWPVNASRPGGPLWGGYDGYECCVDREAALRWLRVHRPEVYRALAEAGWAEVERGTVEWS